MLHDPTHTGIFEPQDVAFLQKVFVHVNAVHPQERDGAKARSLARYIISLYRQGVRDPQQIVDRLDLRLK